MIFAVDPIAVKRGRTVRVIFAKYCTIRREYPGRFAAATRFRDRLAERMVKALATWQAAVYQRRLRFLKGHGFSYSINSFFVSVSTTKE